MADGRLGRNGERGAGVLLHPTSLPGPFGVGDLGPGADAFLRWAAGAGLSCWQMLPVGPTGPTNSPYDGLSAFAGNPVLISPKRLVDDGLLSREALARAPAFARERVEFERVAAWKGAILRQAWDRFRASAAPALRSALDAFREAPEQAPWLGDWTLFVALRNRHAGRAWTEWDEALRLRRPDALARARLDLAEEIRFHEFVQFLFDRQWKRLHAAARRLGVAIFGDLPIYLAEDSADVWAHQDLFAIDGDGRKIAVAGVPPDYFSETGQLWGNPLYRWDRIAESGYAWWVERFRSNLGRSDLLRLDHFRGFAGYWEIPAAARTAVDGRWAKGPGEALFDRVREALGDLPLVAEDLGFITEDVHALRRALGIPCMRVLQFAFDGSPDNPHLPARIEPDTVAYTGTHDNDTVVGWFASLDEGTRGRVLETIGGAPGTIAEDMIRAALRSAAFLAVAPVQDVLGLGTEARFNVPGVAKGNWTWRLEPRKLGSGTAERLARAVEESGRRPER